MTLATLVMLAVPASYCEPGLRKKRPCLEQSPCRLLLYVDWDNHYKLFLVHVDTFFSIVITMYMYTTNLVFKPCYASVGGDPEAYGSRVVCLFVCLSVTSIPRYSLKTKR